jgi:death-on-curing protein
VTWVFLDVESIKRVQADLIDTYGGSHGLRDAGLLESAVMRAENKVNFDPDATIASVGASLSFGLIKNHAFIDGNKRIGLAALVDFLAFNGFILAATLQEQIAMTQRTAASEVSEHAWTVWVEEHIQPIANTD